MPSKETPQTTENSLVVLVQVIKDYLSSSSLINTDTTSYDRVAKTKKIIGFLLKVIGLLAQNRQYLRSVESKLKPLIDESQSFLLINIDTQTESQLIDVHNSAHALLTKIYTHISSASLSLPQNEDLAQATELQGGALSDALMSVILQLLAKDAATPDRLARALGESIATEKSHAAQVAELREIIHELQKKALKDELKGSQETATRRDQELNDQIYALQQERSHDKAMLSIKLEAERRKARRELFEEMDITLVVNLLEKYDLFVANPESENIDLILDTAFIQILAMRAFSLKTTLAGKLEDKIINLVRNTTNADSIHALFDQAEKWIDVHSIQSDQ